MVDRVRSVLEPSSLAANLATFAAIKLQQLTFGVQAPPRIPDADLYVRDARVSEAASAPPFRDAPGTRASQSAVDGKCAIVITMRKPHSKVAGECNFDIMMSQVTVGCALALVIIEGDSQWAAPWGAPSSSHCAAPSSLCCVPEKDRRGMRDHLRTRLPSQQPIKASSFSDSN